MDPITEKELNSYLSLEPFFAFSDKDSEVERQDFVDAYSVLPLTVKSIISGSATFQFLLAIGVEFQISKLKLEGLSKIIRDVLISRIYIGDMQNIIRDYLQLDEVHAKTISSKIVSDLFRPAMEDIKALQRQAFSARIGQPRPQINANQINQNNIIDLKNK
jgi:hypothetical protein